MECVDFEVTLLSDLSVSATNRSLGVPESLDYLPGRLLWGAVAAQLYQRDASAAERVVQMGSVQFLDAVPSLGGERAFSTPRSWHQEKYGDGQIFNLAVARPEGRQMEALPVLWRGRDGQVWPVERRFSVRTAMDGQGRASEGLMYGIEALAEGTRLHARVRSEHKEDLELVAGLLDGAVLHLGRSRGAELGRVQVRRLRARASALEEVNGEVAREVRFLCLSRVALRDPKTGSPTLIATGAHLGLPDGWRFEDSRSFVRVARFSPFNGKRQRPELERQVIERGSVLVFVTDGDGVALSNVRAAIAAGVGEHRAQGLGEVVASPRWLEGPRVELRLRAPAAPSAATSAAPDDELARWSQRRAAARQEATQLWQESHEVAGQLSWVKAAPAQWGELRRMAREARLQGGDDLVAVVDQYLSRGVRGVGVWTQQRQGKGARELLVDELKKRGAQAPVFLELLATRMQREGAAEVRR